MPKNLSCSIKKIAGAVIGIALSTIHPSKAFSQIYYTLTDALMQANHVAGRSRILPGEIVYEDWSYNQKGTTTLHIVFKIYGNSRNGERPMIATEYYTDSVGRIDKTKEYVVEDFKKDHLMRNWLGAEIFESRVFYTYGVNGKILEEKHEDIIDNDDHTMVYYIHYEYRADGTPISKTVTDISGKLRIQWVYGQEAGKARTEQTNYNAAGEKILSQTTWYERPGIPLRIATGENNTTYKNEFNKKGQLIRVTRYNPTKTETFLFIYLRNGLLAAITGPENSTESFRFEYSYFPNNTK